MDIRKKIIELCIKINPHLEDHYFYDYEKMIDDLDFDSLTITQLVIDIEEQFDIMLPPQKISMSEMETFGKLLTWYINVSRARRVDDASNHTIFK